MRTKALLVVLSLVLCAGVASAASVSLANVHNGGMDSYFHTTSWGDTCNAFFIGNGSGNPNISEIGRILAVWDLSSIPAGQTITSAQVRMASFGADFGNTTDVVTISMHEITQAWTAPSWDGYGTGYWATAGGDYDATASSSLASDFVGSTQVRVDFTFTGAGLLTDVQAWYAGGANNGWIFINSDEATPAVRKYVPQLAWEDWDGHLYLDIEYIPEPATLAVLGLGGLLMLIRRRQTV
jgi:hypothetical protein